MGRPDECAALIAEGRSPAQVASGLRISTSSVKKYLFVAVGLGLIQRSDILFSIDTEARQQIDKIRNELATDDPAAVKWAASSRGLCIDPGEIDIYLALERDRAFIGDLYSFIVELETTLHSLIEMILRKTHGNEETGWWRKAVPEKVRIECVTARESDPGDLLPPYCYATLIHLKLIMKKNWSVFIRHLPRSVAGDKARLMKSLQRLNAIRNKVMHPVREGRPAQEEFDFIRDLHRKLHRDRWRSLPA